MTSIVRDKSYPRYPQHPRSPYSFPIDGSGGLSKRTVTRLTAFPDVDGFASGWIDLAGAGMVLLSLKMHNPGWFRLYSTEAAGLLDAERDVDTLPPPTPIILDALTEGAPSTSALDVTGAVAGPGCSADTLFVNVVDGDTATYWITDQDPGNVFAVDFGALVFLASFSMINVSLALSFPGTMSVEVSTDGAAWEMVIPEITGHVRIDVTLPEAVSCRYLRVTSLTFNPDNLNNPWAMSEFKANGAVALSAGTTLDPLKDGDVTGILAFNGEDPARNRLYFNLKIDPADANVVYAHSWGSEMCGLQSWVTAGMPPHIEYQDDYTESYDNCYALDIYQEVDFEFIEDDPSSVRPRFHVLKELRCRGIEGFGRVAPMGTNEEFSATMVITRGDVDTTSFSAGHCFYVNSLLSTWSLAPHIFLGVVRDSATEIALNITWRDGDGNNHTLASLGGIPLDIDEMATFDMEIVKISGVLTARVTLGSDSIQFAVPTDLLNLPNHRSVGLVCGAADPPSAPLAWGGLGITSTIVTGDALTATLDLGYLPIEAPGGSLVIPE